MTILGVILTPEIPKRGCFRPKIFILELIQEKTASCQKTVVQYDSGSNFFAFFKNTKKGLFLPFFSLFFFQANSGVNFSVQKSRFFFL